jgi:hypothetical protein
VLQSLQYFVQIVYSNARESASDPQLCRDPTAAEQQKSKI